jgi:hypothetical protein
MSTALVARIHREQRQMPVGTAGMPTPLARGMPQAQSVHGPEHPPASPRVGEKVAVQGIVEHGRGDRFGKPWDCRNGRTDHDVYSIHRERFTRKGFGFGAAPVAPAVVLPMSNSPVD